MISAYPEGADMALTHEKEVICNIRKRKKKAPSNSSTICRFVSNASRRIPPELTLLPQDIPLFGNLSNKANPSSPILISSPFMGTYASSPQRSPKTERQSVEHPHHYPLAASPGLVQSASESIPIPSHTGRNLCFQASD